MSKTQITAEPGIPQIVIETEFDAPAELLYRAHVDPELLVQWMGPRRLRMRVDEYDVNHGGTYRFVHIDEDGTEYGFRGVHHGTPSVENGISRTFEFEGMPGHVSYETLEFVEQDGKTLLRGISVFTSIEDRDGMIASGMETGVVDSMERLAELIPSLAPAR